MKLQPLYDLQQEINRLFIAGSKFAKGDPRLLKHVPVFNKLGEKAPVFKKLAADIEELVNTESLQSSEKLSSISVLLYSILYTQGETTEDISEEKPLSPEFNLNQINTEKTYLQLKPVIEALTVSSSGRIEVLEDAFKQGVFKDFRTFQYLNLGLADRYTELAQYIESAIIPKIGTPIIPFLLRSFEYNDKTDNIRRLHLLNELKYPGISEIIEKVLSGNLPNMQAKAITILSDNPKNEELVIKLAEDKNKVVRESAFMALAKLNTKASLEKLVEIYQKNKNKNNVSGIVLAIAQTKLPFFFQEVCNQFNATFQALLETPDDKFIDAFEKFTEELTLFKNKDREETYKLFLEVVSNKKLKNLVTTKQNLLGYRVSFVERSIKANLDTFNPKKVLDFYPELISKTVYPEATNPFRNSYLNCCTEANYPKEKVFDIFSEQFPNNGVTNNDLYEICANKTSLYQHNYTLDIGRIDSRWISLIYSTLKETISNPKRWNNLNEKGLKLINLYEPKGAEEFNKLLVDYVSKVSPGHTIPFFKIIMERDLPKKYDIIFSTISNFPKGTYYYGLHSLRGSEFWGKFPKEYAEKFKKLYENTKISVYAEISEEIEKG